MNELLKPLLNRILLPLLISGLVFFVGKGWITDQESEQIAAAIALLVVNIGVGLLQKYIQSKKVETALELPANSSKAKLKKEIGNRQDVVSVLAKIFS